MTSWHLPWRRLPANCSARSSSVACGGRSRRVLSPSGQRLWFLGSLLLRTGTVLAGFYFVSQDHWSRIMACLAGFVIAHVIVVKWLTRAPAKEQTALEKETSIAD